MESTEPTSETSTPGTTPGVELNSGAPFPEGLAAEIAAGVDALVAKNEDEPAADDIAIEETAPDDAGPGAEDEVDSTDSEPPADPAPEAGLSDEVTERAIRAGFSLKEIKQCPDDAFLERMCARIEGAKGETGSQKDAANDDGGEPSIDDILSEIPDLDPEEVEESIVSAFKSMKGFMKRSLEDNANLRKEIAGMQEGQTKDWLTTKIEGVKDFTKGDADRIASVRKKFEILQAGYKAAGESVTRDVVFGEAAKMVLGSEMTAAKQKSKTKAARSRNGQFIARPSGNRAEPKVGFRDQVGAMIDARFGS
jgi:hypothetical protein